MNNNPENKNQQINDPKSPNIARQGKSPFYWMIIGLIIITMFMVLMKSQSVTEISYFPDFIKHVEDGHVKKVKFYPTKITGEFNLAGKEARDSNDPANFEVYYPISMQDDTLKPLLEKYDVEYEGKPDDMLMPLLIQLLPFLIVFLFIYFIFIRNMRAGGGGMLMNFGKSRHKLRGKEQKITFDNVAGIEEAKEEVAETIEFLKNPKKFQKIGGRIPRGVLLVGPPGCGKTLLAKAIAGESDVPFFSISGSDFVEMFVGVGASRVRNLFKEAKENAPCIIFLDEIDAIGKKRGPGFVSGGHDEREQTLNAILVEMDGFDTDDQVIVIAATNRDEILDKALTRPGRFDRQVMVPLPDLNGRVKILKIHARKIKVGPDVDFEKLARGTAMFSGAELEALINEGAISASMADKDFVDMSDMEEARDKVRWGRAKRSRAIDEYDKRLTAYHEAGHALVQALLEDADPLHKVSIIPRGPMGGATFALPEKDRLYYSKKYCVAEMQVCYAGRIAEEIFCDDISSGAQSDIKQATAIAREMVMNWGMGKNIGPINYAGNMSGDYYPSSTPDYSDRTAEMIDQEVKTLIDEAYSKARTIIENHRNEMEAIVSALIKYETLDSDEVKLLLEGGQLDKPTVADLLLMEKEKAGAKENEDNSGENQQGNDNTDETAPSDEEK